MLHLSQPQPEDFDLSKWEGYKVIHSLTSIENFWLRAAIRYCQMIGGWLPFSWMNLEEWIEQSDYPEKLDMPTDLPDKISETTRQRLALRKAYANILLRGWVKEDTKGYITLQPELIDSLAESLMQS